MGWSDFAAVAAEGKDDAEIEKENARELRRAMRGLLENPVAKQYLASIAAGRSYVGGRKFEEVAFAEGQRHMALQILRLGGELDGGRDN